jgi:uncharacterized protein (TIGR03435 family)
VDHLWQSTLFAGVAWVVTLALRRNRAQVRYWVWFTASVKFLAPLALLVALGELAPRRAAVPMAQTEWVVLAQDQIDKRCPARGGGSGLNAKIDAQGMTIDEFSKIFLNTPALDWRPIINKTGVAGRFDFHLEFAPDPGAPSDDPGGGVPLFAALQEQLGLKLESAKGPAEFLVIDSVERPSES